MIRQIFGMAYFSKDLRTGDTLDIAWEICPSKENKIQKLLMIEMACPLQIGHCAHKSTTCVFKYLDNEISTPFDYVESGDPNWQVVFLRKKIENLYMYELECIIQYVFPLYILPGNIIFKALIEV